MSRTIDSVIRAFGAGLIVVASGIGDIAANQRMPPEKRIVMKSQEIPSSVLGRLKELREEAKREGYIYVGVDYCTRGNQKIFTVLSGGGLGTSYDFYTIGGKSMGSYSGPDYVIVGQPGPKPPVDLQRFDCKEIQIVDVQ